MFNAIDDRVCTHTHMHTQAHAHSSTHVRAAFGPLRLFTPPTHAHNTSANPPNPAGIAQTGPPSIFLTSSPCRSCTVLQRSCTVLHVAPQRLGYGCGFRASACPASTHSTRGMKPPPTMHEGALHSRMMHTRICVTLGGSAPECSQLLTLANDAYEDMRHTWRQLEMAWRDRGREIERRACGAGGGLLGPTHTHAHYAHHARDHSHTHVEKSSKTSKQVDRERKQHGHAMCTLYVCVCVRRVHT